MSKDKAELQKVRKKAIFIGVIFALISLRYIRAYFSSDTTFGAFELLIGTAGTIYFLGFICAWLVEKTFHSDYSYLKTVSLIGMVFPLFWGIEFFLDSYSTFGFTIDGVVVSLFVFAVFLTPLIWLNKTVSYYGFLGEEKKH